MWPVRSIDHLGEMLMDLGKGSRLEKLRMHRTKCSMVIANVLAPAMLTDLVYDINACKSGYSLIVDESTDTSSNKFMGIVVRYVLFNVLKYFTASAS